MGRVRQRRAVHDHVRVLRGGMRGRALRVLLLLLLLGRLRAGVGRRVGVGVCVAAAGRRGEAWLLVLVGLEGEGEALALGDGAELAGEYLGLAEVAQLEDGPCAEPALVAAPRALEDLEGGARLLALLHHEAELLELELDGPLDPGDGVREHCGAVGGGVVGGGGELGLAGVALEAVLVAGVEEGERSRGGLLLLLLLMLL